MNKLIQLVLVTSFLVTGCNGGGGSTTPATGVQVTPTPTPVATYDLIGKVATAAMVPLGGAIVRIIDPITTVTTTGSDGNYTQRGIPNGSYTVTVELAGYNIDPASAVVVVSGANATQDFTATEIAIVPPAATLMSGKYLYPCWYDGIFKGPYACVRDMAAGTSTYVKQASSNLPSPFGINLVLNRTNYLASFGSDNGGIGGVWLSDGTTVSQVDPSKFWGTSCPDTPKGSFDIGQVGDVIVFSGECPGKVNGNDIVIMLTDWSGYWSPVTGHTSSFEWSPVIASPGDQNSNAITVFYTSNMPNGSVPCDVCVWKQVINPVAGTTETPMFVINTGFTRSPTDPTNPFAVQQGVPYLTINEKVISVDRGYTTLAFTILQNGVPHIAIIPIVGGTPTVLTEGRHPRFALDGSGRIFYRCGTEQCAINPDVNNLDKRLIVLPDNLSEAVGSADEIISAPFGF